MEIFQDGAFPNLEYHLFQVIWCSFSINYVKLLCKMRPFVGKKHINLGIKHYLDTSFRISWKYSKMRHFPTWNITCFK